MIDTRPRLRPIDRMEQAIRDVVHVVETCGSATTPEIVAYLDDLDARSQQGAICMAHRRGLIWRVRGGGRGGPAEYRPVARPPRRGVS